MNNVSLKNLVAKQVPEFVREEHPAFVQFLEAYYDFLEQNYKTDIESLRDLDKTLDAFIISIKKELDVFGDEDYDYIDKILLLRKIKQVFNAKGSEAAYRFLFKILYDKPVNITYPWDSVLKASDGKWKRDTSIFVRISSGDPLTLVGKRVPILGNNKRIFVYVDNVRSVGPDVFEIFIEKSYYGILETGFTISVDSVNGVLLPTTTDYEIISSGTGYKVGDLIPVNTFANEKTITHLIKVTKINTVGGIEKIRIIQFNYDYQTEFFFYTTNAQVIRKTRIRTSKNGNPQFDLPDSNEIEKYSDYGNIIDPNYWVSYTVSNSINSVDDINLVTNSINKTNHRFVTGDVVLYSVNGGTAIEGLVNNTNYFVIKVTDNQIKLATTFANALAGTSIDLTAYGVGTHLLSANPFSSVNYAGLQLQQFSTDTINTQIASEDFTLIKFNIGAVAKYQGYYTSNDGFLSDNIYLQDGRFYQKYSYLLTVDEQLKSYKALITSYLHPAGTALFGEYQIQARFKSNLSADLNIGIFDAQTVFNSINKDIAGTSALISGLGGSIRIDPYDLESYFLEDYNPDTQQPFTG
jgi:hypothetical protein